METMTAAAESSRTAAAGMSRLLEHCEVLSRVTGGHATTARTRLAGELGNELAERLVGALARRGARSPFLGV